MDNTNNPFLTTFRLPVKMSPILYRIVIILHIISLILVWNNALSILTRIILSGLITANFYVYCRKIRLSKSFKGVCNLILNAEDEWQVKMQDGSTYNAILENHVFVHPWLTIFSLKFNQRRQYFIFTPEILDTDTFRRLRVRLRFRVGE